jgi:hypothetical protein
VEYERPISALRSADGISEEEMYSDRTSKASSWKLSFDHVEAQLAGGEGIASGMKRPWSEARPLSTTSSNENWARLSLMSCGLGSVSTTYAVGAPARAQISL